MTPVRTRFAPSPTGYLHLGGARTALFNWLFARKHGGTFVLRVEDTDEKRNKAEAFEAIYSGMEWMGLDWDEGAEKGGEFGPYNQSERGEIYEKWFQKLIDVDRVYQEEDGAWRFRFERKEVTLHDLVCGEITIDYRNEEINPDMTVRRPDGTFTFHFVNVVDDLEMEISHVIRGEDHLMNTPKHLQLYEALGATAPQFAHIPLILNDDGKKMSKRDEGSAVKDYVEMGFLPEGMLNFVALLGWNPKSDQELFTAEELIEGFDLSQVNRAPARFDLKKALWMNQQYVVELEEEEFYDAVEPYLQAAGLPVEHPNMRDAIKHVHEKVNTLEAAVGAVAFLFEDDFDYLDEALEKVAKNESAPALLQALCDTWRDLEDWSEAKDQIGATAKANGAKPGQLMFPTRVALSGMGGGLDLGLIIHYLGQENCISRLEHYLTQFA